VRIGHPTEDELHENFAEMLESVRRGGGLRTETGLDMDTEEALWDIARAYPDVTDELVDAARAAFARQLDGSNASARRAELERMFEEMRRSRGDR
jgi:acyl-CoA reductase-like NAD-dependent aldehyde dehydrogenase